MWLLALVPAGWMAVFGSFVLRARLALGHWPTPYHPDPKDLGFDVHYAGVLVGMPLMFAAIASLAGLLLLSYLRPQDDDASPGAAALVGVLSLLTLIVVARYDPIGLFTWLAD
jgi:hypothetical protein